MQFRIENMTCGGRLRSGALSIRSVDPAAQATVEPATRAIPVGSAAPHERLAAALTGIGQAPA